MTETLTAQTDGRGIDNRQHFFNIAGDQRVVQGLVTILQVAQHDVTVQITGQGSPGIQATGHLFVQGQDMWGQQTIQPKRIAFLCAECRALVEQGLCQNGEG